MKQSSVIIISSQAKEFAAQFGFVVPKNAIVVEEATTKSLPLWGLASAHDNVNAECAVHAVRAITGASYDQVADAMRGFPGLPHRCELVATKAPFRFINDSKATNVQSTEAALSAISRPCVLLLGGQGKGESFGSIMNYQEKIKQIIAFGRDASVIGEQLKSHFQLSKFDTLASALDYLFTREENIECDVLFSPGCASFDEFKNFERRGEFFKSRVIAKFGQL